MSYEPNWKLYSYVMAAFAVILVLSNIVAAKLWALGPFVFAGGLVLFPISYILGDVVVEVYGYAGGRKIFWVGLAANVFMVIVLLITDALPGIDPEFSAKYHDVLLQVPRIVFASAVGVWLGQFVNAFVMSRMKVLTNSKYLWMRTIGSTLCGEFVDTTLFIILAFGFTLPWSVVGNMIVTGTVAKTLYEAAVTPITYIVVNWFKRVEDVEAFDAGENYSPFKSGRGGRIEDVR